MNSKHIICCLSPSNNHSVLAKFEHMMCQKHQATTLTISSLNITSAVVGLQEVKFKMWLSLILDFFFPPLLIFKLSLMFTHLLYQVIPANHTPLVIHQSAAITRDSPSPSSIFLSLNYQSLYPQTSSHFPKMTLPPFSVRSDWYVSRHHKRR